MADNTINLTGNVTRDPELRYTGNNQAVCTFGLAVNRRWQNRQSQEWEESTSFFDVVSWGTLAENIADSLTKGTRVIVSGRLEQRSWETQDGEKRSKVEVVADEVGPSLRWATAKAEKTMTRNGTGSGDRDRGGPDRGGQDRGGQDRGPDRGAGSQERGTYQPAAAAPQAGYHDSAEEPF